MTITGNLEKDISYIKRDLTSSDVSFIDLMVGNNKAILIFIEELTDKKSLGDFVISPIKNFNGEISAKSLREIFLSPLIKEIHSIKQVKEEVSSGKSVVMCDRIKCAFSFPLLKFEKRSIAEPPTSTVIKGPREGFVENLNVNISLMRRRLKSPDFIIETMEVGNVSKTSVSLLYLKNICNKNLLKTLKNKISNIDINVILDSSYISKFLGEHKTSLFKQIGNTEKPDILTSKIMEGRVAILVDGSPIALTVPYLLIEDFQSPSDYYNSCYSASFARIIRVFAVMVSILLPAIFVSAELFHLQLIPLSFLLTIVNSIKGIPLSPSYEMFLTLLIFEILNEASIRMPRYVGMVVSIVGGLVLGETAVNAGIISAPTLMIVAFSGICLYTVPELVQTFSILRLVFLIIGGTLGGYGLILASIGLLIYLVSFENYGTPLTAPYSPLISSDLNDGIIKKFTYDKDNKLLSIKRSKIKEKNK